MSNTWRFYGRKYLVQEIGVFGSCVRGEEREDSDIDILVEFKEPVDFFHFLDLEEYLTSILGKKVDLVMKRALKPEIGKRILEEVIYVTTNSNSWKKWELPEERLANHMGELVAAGSNSDKE